MSELSKERIQQIWDYELIKAWDEKGKNKMWKVVFNFMKRVKGIKKIDDVSFEDTEDYLCSLQLRRCLDIDYKKGWHVFRAWRTDVIGFIHARSEPLSMALISGEDKPVILMGIDNYKWIKKDTGAASSFRAKQRAKRKKDSANIKIRARSLTASTDWSKTK